jgi:RecA/RadA recombinase
MSTQLETIEQRAKQAQALKLQATKEYEAGNIDKAINTEREFLKLRMSVIDEITQEVKRQKSKPIWQIKKEVAARPKVIRRETGIPALDRELVTDDEYGYGKIGGFGIGNFIQIVGSKGAGKSTLLMKIITNISLHEKVCWFDFEMGDARVVQKLNSFTYSDENLLYYNSDRDLTSVIDEIKFLHAMGACHFVIDSTMKITVKGADKLDRNSIISSSLSELTSTLGINIYIINQMSQQAEEMQVLKIKHGNDVEYDADFIFFILTLPKRENGKIIKDEIGRPVEDDTKRAIICTKNRQDERKFTVLIPKEQLMPTAIKEVIFERSYIDN